MRAYTKGITKTEFINELKKHQQADNFVKGVYWDDETHRGCAVGCSLQSISKIKKANINFAEHYEYENWLGIPSWLARLEDTIYEYLRSERSKQWPVQFAKAINRGSDLNKVKTPLLVYILKLTIERLVSLDRNIAMVQRAIEVNKNIIKGLKANDEDLIARAAAEGAAAGAGAAAAAGAAAGARAAAAAAGGAIAAAGAAAGARAAAAGARAAAGAEAAAAAAVEWEKIADKLLQLLKECK